MSAKAACLFAFLAATLLSACATTYEPVESGPSSNLTVTQSGADGLLADLTLYISSQAQEYGWKKIEDAAPFKIPAGEPLALTLAYRNQVLFGGTLTGSEMMILTPRDGASYVMTFWTDNEQFRVDLFEEDARGKRIPMPQARVQPRN